LIKVEIVETLRRVIEVGVGDAGNALLQTQELYDTGQLVLDYKDFAGYEINVLENK